MQTKTFPDAELGQLIMDCVNVSNNVSPEDINGNTKLLLLFASLRFLSQHMEDNYGLLSEDKVEFVKHKNIQAALPKSIRGYITSIVMNAKRHFNEIDGDKQFVCSTISTEMISGAFGEGKDSIFCLNEIFHDDKLIKFHKGEDGKYRLLCGKNFPDWANQ